MAVEMSTNVTSSLEAVISSDRPEVSLEGPLVAVNWFDTRSLWLYNLYNVLASRSVSAVGGEVVFKGKLDTVIAGDDTKRRGMLLIVRYPSGRAFLNMMESTYFKLVSLLREAAVSNFTFCFTQPTLPATYQDDPDKAQTYLIHTAASEDENRAILTLVKQSDLNILYAGQLAARLGIRRSGAPTQNIPCLIEWITVTQTETDEQLNNLKQLMGTTGFDKKNSGAMLTAALKRLR